VIAEYFLWKIVSLPLISQIWMKGNTGVVLSDLNKMKRNGWHLKQYLPCGASNPLIWQS